MRSLCPEVQRFSRRRFLATTSAATVGVGMGVGLSGCATHPVTGKSTFLLMTEGDEISEDRAAAPHQFSADYGICQDDDLNAYVNEVGTRMGAKSHRPHMPYSFRAVNSPVANAYTFAGGSCAITRGLLLEMENEASLASVLGHEIGHVNMRHRAQSATQSILANLVVVGATVYVAEKHEDYAALAAGLGSIAAGALLATYSRADEREADDLGMDYAVAVGQNPMGMSQLMDILQRMGRSKPSLIERMFASHPMSQERYDTTLNRAQNQYPDTLDRDLNRERFMDHTANLRRNKEAVEAQQAGTACMMQQAFTDAEQHYARAIKLAPNDYAGLMMMANCQRMVGKAQGASRWAQRAMAVYPEEAQALFFAGVLDSERGNFGNALKRFSTYRDVLPGNPLVDYNCGVCFEKMGRRESAAEEYVRFLKQVQEGDEALHAYTRLVEWGVIEPQADEGSSS